MMAPNSHPSKVICVTGMHRSGTSLMASYLQHCGIPIGDELREAGAGNRLGHFENQSFLELHKRILAANNTNMYVPTKKLVVSERQHYDALSLVRRNSERYGLWAWKEPRTSLFIDFWRAIVPNAYFIILYRDPMKVVESLYRRMKARYKYVRPWLAPLSWIHYNRILVEFAKKNKEQTQVINIENFNENSEYGRQRLEDWLRIDLNKNYTDVFREEEMTSGSALTKPFPLDIYLPIVKLMFSAEFGVVFNELEQLSARK